MLRASNTLDGSFRLVAEPATRLRALRIQLADLEAWGDHDRAIETAAKICAALIESERPCETAVFDGQRLAIKSDDPAPSARPPRKRSAVKRVSSEEQPPKPKSSALSSMFSTR